MAGERDDFGQVYDDHIWHVYGFFGYRLSSREECEDLTQQTFERALKSWRRFDPERASAKTWLLAIARNLLIDFYRRRGASHETLVDEVPADALEDEAASPEFRLGIDPDLERALDALGARERELLALRYGGDLTGPEIAEITGLSLANVHQILSRGLRKLRTDLGEDTEEAAGDPAADAG